MGAWRNAIKRRGVHKRGTELLESGDVEKYADMLARACAVRRADGRDEAAGALLATEADRWLGESKLGPDRMTEPVGLASDVERLAN